VYRTILVAYDGSPGADAALQSAVALAGAAGGTLHLVHSCQIPRPERPGASRRSARKGSSGAVNPLRTNRARSAVTRVVRGDPVAGIIPAAEDIRADLIVAGFVGGR
jgi:nucleotide-binding universal stress UspA family protein